MGHGKYTLRGTLPSKKPNRHRLDRGHTPPLQYPDDIYENLPEGKRERRAMLEERKASIRETYQNFLEKSLLTWLTRG